MFGEKGFAGAKLEDVAARAGIAKGTIYRYFAGKEELFIAAVASRTDAILGAAARGSDFSAAAPQEQMATLIRRLYQAAFGSDLEVLIRIVVTEGRHFPDLARAYHDRIVASGRDLLGGIVARGIASGQFRDGPASRQPMILIAPLLMAAVWRMLFDPLDPLDLEAFIDAHVDLILNGLAA